MANERKVVIIGSSTTAAGITAIGPFVFRTAVPESDVLPVTMKTAQDKLGIKKVAVMYANDNAFSKSGYDTFKEVIDKLGMTTLTTETFAEKDSDFAAQLPRAKSLNPDAAIVARREPPPASRCRPARSVSTRRSSSAATASTVELMEIAGRRPKARWWAAPGS